MEISSEEARESLAQAQDAAARTRKLLACRGADALFVVWGLVWFLGYLGTDLAPRLLALGKGGEDRGETAVWIVNGIWLALIALGIVVSVAVWKRRSPTKTSSGARLGWFWLLLYVYVSVWIFLLWPFIKVEGAAESVRFGRHMGAIEATVPMFAYVVMGLWLDHFMIWIGLAITGLTVLGLFLAPAWFWIWMAVMGGGSLVSTGFLIRNRWR
ncbi:MAG: hypothetical protein ABSA67_07475 [Candidatus Brocadiia bacterium]|jgi:hypothetical protein